MEDQEKWISGSINRPSLGKRAYFEENTKSQKKVSKKIENNFSSNGDSKNEETVCGVCQSPENIVLFCNTDVCLSCKSFFLRYSQITRYIGCIQGAKCDVSGRSRLKCKPCRFQKCLDIGLTKSKVSYNTTKMNFTMYPCVICGVPSNGYHFGAVTCDACRNFFHKSKNLFQSFVCVNALQMGSCETTHLNHACKYCRYQKCLQNGMANSNIKLGRPSREQLRVNRKRMNDLGIKPAPSKKIVLPNENKSENKSPIVVLLLPNNGNSNPLKSTLPVPKTPAESSIRKSNSNDSSTHKPMIIRQIVKTAKPSNKKVSVAKNKKAACKKSLKRGRKKGETKKAKSEAVDRSGNAEEDTLDLDYEAAFESLLDAKDEEGGAGRNGEKDKKFVPRVKKNKKTKKGFKNRRPTGAGNTRRSESPSKATNHIVILPRPDFKLYANFDQPVVDPTSGGDDVSATNGEATRSVTLDEVKAESGRNIPHFQNGGVNGGASSVRIIYLPSSAGGESNNAASCNASGGTRTGNLDRQTLASFLPQNFVQNGAGAGDGAAISIINGQVKIGQMGPTKIGQSGPIVIGQSGPPVIDQGGQIKIGQGGPIVIGRRSSSPTEVRNACGQNLIASILSSEKNRSGRTLAKMADAANVEKPQSEILADAYNSILTQIQFQSTPKRILPKAALPPSSCQTTAPIKRERFLPSSKYLNKNEEKCFVCRTRKASGYHFGVVSCNACMKFFRLSADDSASYRCEKGAQNCDLTLGVFVCKFCRYQKCIQLGMTHRGKRIGRPTRDRISKLRSNFEERCKTISQATVATDTVTKIETPTTAPPITESAPKIGNPLMAYNQSNSYQLFNPTAPIVNIQANNVIMVSMVSNLTPNNHFSPFYSSAGNPAATWLDPTADSMPSKDFATLDTVARRQAAMETAARLYTRSVANPINMDFMDYLDNVQEVVEVEVGDLQVD